MFPSPHAGGPDRRSPTLPIPETDEADEVRTVSTEGAAVEQHPAQAALPITVTRIGTQVVVRPMGNLDDACADSLAAVVREVEALALRRVVVDLDEVGRIEGAGLDFLTTLHGRWSLRLINTPAGLRARLPHPRA
jgi:hypothetical protein